MFLWLTATHFNCTAEVNLNGNIWRRRFRARRCTAWHATLIMFMQSTSPKFSYAAEFQRLQHPRSSVSKQEPKEVVLLFVVSWQYLAIGFGPKILRNVCGLRAPRGARFRRSSIHGDPSCAARFDLRFCCGVSWHGVICSCAWSETRLTKCIACTIFNVSSSGGGNT